MERPQASEYNPYYEKYIEKIADGNILDILKQQHEETVQLLDNISEAKSEYRYAPGKWSLKEVVGHMADTERIMSYRLLAIARGDTNQFPSFDENAYVETAHFCQRSFVDLRANFHAVRQATLSLLANIPNDAWLRKAVVSGAETTVRALAYIIAGHEHHHRTIIQERYLSE